MRYQVSTTAGEPFEVNADNDTAAVDAAREHEIHGAPGEHSVLVEQDGRDVSTFTFLIPAPLPNADADADAEAPNTEADRVRARVRGRK